MIYKCIKSFKISKYDKDEQLKDGTFMTIGKGTKWEDDTFVPLRLIEISNKGLRYIDVTYDTLKEHFKEKQK